MSILFSNVRQFKVRASLLSNIIKQQSYSYHTPVVYSKTSQKSEIDEITSAPSLSANYNVNRQNLHLPMVTKQSYFNVFKEMIGFQGSLKYPQPVLTVASYRLYLCIQLQVDYDKFFKLLNSPDTMYSFCLVTFLHIWLLSVPLMQLGQTGLFVRKALYKNMWKDIEIRDRKLKRPMKKKDKRHTYQYLNDIFRGHLIGFDEGLLSDDDVLAGAVWRHLLEMNEIKDYAVLGQMCDYIRKNIQHLDNNVNEFDYLKAGIVSFVDIDQKEVDHLKARQQLIEKIKEKENEESE